MSNVMTMMGHRLAAALLYGIGIWFSFPVWADEIKAPMPSAVNQVRTETEVKTTVIKNNQTLPMSTSHHTEEHTWKTRFLSVLAEPAFVYLLLLLGIYGIVFEAIHPGFIMPGIIGAIAILLALYGLQLLSVNYIGLALILLGMALVGAEAFVPSFGVLGLGGSVAFIIGSIILFKDGHAGSQIAWAAILAMGIANLLFFFMMVNMLVKSRRKPLQHGLDILVGREGKTIDNIELSGQALVDGEIWAVQAKHPIAAGKMVRVVAVRGLCLEVEEKD